VTSLTYVQVTGRFVDGSGNPLSGSAEFTPTAAVYAAGVPVLTPDTPVLALITAGHLQTPAGGVVGLLATDNAGLELLPPASFWCWSAEVTLSGQVQPAWQFFLPSSPASTDLYALAQTQVAAFANPMTGTGDLIAGGAAGVPGRLAGNASAAREFLISQGTGTAAQAPAWGALQAGDIPALPYDASGAASAAQAAAQSFATSAVASEASRAAAAEGLAAQKSANLADLPSAGTARVNLGLGSAATQPSSAFDAAGAATAAAAASAAYFTRVFAV
jgi:hypothetical protein